MEFRKLKPEEIDVRVGTVNEKAQGITLLLYKDARVDMTILDETVGAFNWNRQHMELKGNIYCGVTIKHDNLIATKWDAGSESFTEKEKGEASDSFKRACVCWGIGRELYTAPFIWINCQVKDKKVIDKTDRGMKVKSIGYDAEGRINQLEIVNNKGTIYKMGEAKTKQKATDKQLLFIDKLNLDMPALLKFYKIKSVEELTIEQASEIIDKKGSK